MSKFGSGSNSNGAFWYGNATNFPGFLYKKNLGVGGRRSTRMVPGGNTITNQQTDINNKYKPGSGGIGGSSIANRRAKNRLATVCNGANNCGQFYQYLGRYDNYTGNPNGFFNYPLNNVNNTSVSSDTSSGSTTTTFRVIFSESSSIPYGNAALLYWDAYVETSQSLSQHTYKGSNTYVIPSLNQINYASLNNYKSSSSGEITYNVYDYSRATLYATSITETYLLIRGLESETQYTFIVEPVYQGLKKLPSIITAKTETTDTTGISLNSLTATSYSDYISLEWTHSSTLLGITYNIYNSSYDNYTRDVTNEQFNIVGLEPETSYTFIVEPVYQGLKKLPSIITATTTEKIELSELTVESEDKNSVDLTWRLHDDSSKYSSSIQYKIYEVDASDNTKTLKDTVDAETFSTTVTGLASNTTYNFMVKPYYNGTEYTGITIEATTLSVRLKLSNLDGTPHYYYIDLYWTLNETVSEYSEIEYYINFKEVTISNTTLITTITTSDTYITLQNLNENTIYNITVTPYCDGYQGEGKTINYRTHEKVHIETLKADVSFNSVYLTWTLHEDSEEFNSETVYKIYGYEANGYSNYSIKYTTELGRLDAELKDLLSNVIYIYEVRAYYKEKEYVSYNSYILFTTTSVTAELKNITATADTNSILLSWTLDDASIPYQDSLYYYIYLNEQRIKTVNIEKSTTLSDLDSNTQYEIKVTPYCNSIEGTSSTIYVSTTSTTETNDVTISNLTATAYSDSVYLSWDVSSTYTGITYYIYVNNELKTSTSETNTTIHGLTSNTEYSFGVTPYYNGSQSGAYISTTATPVSITIRELTTIPFANAVYLSWTADPSIYSDASYNIYVDLSYNTSTIDKSIIISSLTNNRPYSFTVTPYYNGSLAGYDASINATPVSITISDLTATAYYDSVYLSWNPNPLYSEMTYKIYVDGSYNTTTSDTSITISGLTSNIQHSFTVTPYYNDYLAGYEASINATQVSITIINLSANAYTNSVHLSWDVSSTYTGIMYDIKMGETYYTTTSDTSITISDLTNETSYSFTVTPYYNGSSAGTGSSTTATPVSITISDLTATAYYDSVYLSWNPNPLYSGMTYKIYVDGSYNTSTSETNTTIHGLTSNIQHSFTVTPYYNDYLAGYEASINATQVSITIINLSANAYTNSVHLSWDVSSTYTGIMYDIKMGETYYTTTSDTSITISDLTNETSYSFTVTPYYNGSSAGAGSSTTATPVSIAITDLTATAYYDSVYLSWTATLSYTGMTYKIYVDGSYYTTTSDTNITLSGLTSNTEYTFTVTPYYNDYLAGYDAYINATPVSIEINDLTATAYSDSVYLSWTATLSYTGMTYKIYVDGSYNTTTSETSITISDLTNETSYSFTVTPYYNGSSAGTGVTTTTTTTTFYTPTTFSNILNLTYSDNNVSSSATTISNRSRYVIKIGSDTSYLGIESSNSQTNFSAVYNDISSFNSTSTTANYKKVLGSIFQLVKNNIDTYEYYRITSELHSNYSLDCSWNSTGSYSTSLNFSNNWGMDRTTTTIFKNPYITENAGNTTSSGSGGSPGYIVFEFSNNKLKVKNRYYYDDNYYINTGTVSNPNTYDNYYGVYNAGGGGEGHILDTSFASIYASSTAYYLYYNSSTSSFEISTNSSTITLYNSPIDLSVPTQFNPSNRYPYVSNLTASLYAAGVTSTGQTQLVNRNTSVVNRIATISKTSPSGYSYIGQIYTYMFTNGFMEITNKDTADASANSMLDIIFLTNQDLRYSKDFYIALRNGLLENATSSHSLSNAYLTGKTVLQVYFTNEYDTSSVRHPFMVILNTSSPSGPCRFLDVCKPPGDAKSHSGLPTAEYDDQYVTRSAAYQNFLTKIPLRDYGNITSIDSSGGDANYSTVYLSSLAYENSSTSLDYFNYASKSACGIAIDSTQLYPVLNNTLTPSCGAGELTASGHHSGQGLGTHYHADSFQCGTNTLNLYNQTDYVGQSHPPLVGMGFDGIALYGSYKVGYDISVNTIDGTTTESYDKLYSNMEGYDVSLNSFGAHTHGIYGYHYHANPISSLDIPCYSSKLNPNEKKSSSCVYPVYALLYGSMAGNVSSIPNYQDLDIPSQKNRYVGYSSNYLNS